MSIKMDSRTPQEPKPDAEKNFAIQFVKTNCPGRGSHRTTKIGPSRWRLGYGDFVRRPVFDNYWNYFAKARSQNRAELADPVT